MQVIKFTKRDGVFAGIILLVHVCFFVMACYYKRIYMGDSYEYIYEAVNILKRGFFYSGNPAMTILPEYMTQRQPMYPLFLAGVYVFGINNWVVLVLQNLLSVFNICYVRRLLVRAGYNQRYDWLLLLFIMGYPAQFINASTIAPDILLQTCTVLYFGCFGRLWQTGRWQWALWMCLWLTVGMMVKPVLYPFAAVHVLLIAGCAIYRRGSAGRVCTAALLPVLAVLAYNYSNCVRTGKFHFSSNQAFNAIYYYYPFISQREGADSAGRFLVAERAAIAAIPIYKQRYDYANKRGSTLLRENFLPYMIFHLKHAARIFIEPGKAELDLFTGRLTYGRLYSKEQTGFYATLSAQGWRGLGTYLSRNPSMPVVLLVLLLNCVRLLGMYLFFRRGRAPWQWKAALLVLVLYFAVAAGPIANTRYLLPVSLLMAGVAVMGWSSSRSEQLAVNSEQ